MLQVQQQRSFMNILILFSSCYHSNEKNLISALNIHTNSLKSRLFGPGGHFQRYLFIKILQVQCTAKNTTKTFKCHLCTFKAVWQSNIVIIRFKWVQRVQRSKMVHLFQFNTSPQRAGWLYHQKLRQRRYQESWLLRL